MASRAPRGARELKLEKRFPGVPICKGRAPRGARELKLRCHVLGGVVQRVALREERVN